MKIEDIIKNTLWELAIIVSFIMLLNTESIVWLGVLIVAAIKSE